MAFQALPFLEMDKQVWTQDIYLSVILFLQENNDQENENNNWSTFITEKLCSRPIPGALRGLFNLI